jgi:hypothetical protein
VTWRRRCISQRRIGSVPTRQVSTLRTAACPPTGRTMSASCAASCPRIRRKSWPEPRTANPMPNHRRRAGGGALVLLVCRFTLAASSGFLERATACSFASRRWPRDRLLPPVTGSLGLRFRRMSPHRRGKKGSAKRSPVALARDNASAMVETAASRFSTVASRSASRPSKIGRKACYRPRCSLR